MDGWISVKDRLPKDFQKVLVWYESFGHDIGWYCNGAWQFLCDNLSKNVKVMAWMPLPEPPRMEEE